MLKRFLSFCLLLSSLLWSDKIETTVLPLGPEQSVTVWRSSKSDGKELILLSHGYRGHPVSMAWLAERLASEGYIVAAPHHLDSYTSADYWKRPLDISGTLDIVLASPIGKNVEHVGLAGFSLGGTTGLWLAGGCVRDPSKLRPTDDVANPEVFAMLTDEVLANVDQEKLSADYSDPRIQAYFLMAPALTWMFECLQKIDAPLFIVAPESDEVVKSSATLARFPSAQLLPGKAGHYVFLEKVDRYDERLRFLFEDHPSVDRKQIQREVGDQAVQFFQKTLP